MNKSDLRKLYLEKQKNLSTEERSALSVQIAANFFSGFDLRRIEYLHCFLPIIKFNEIDTRPIFERIWTDFPHIETVVPRVDFQTLEMQSLIFTDQTALVKNVWQIAEPSHDQTIEPSKIDAVLVPLLCFDTRGFRVGYGKGFYDKFLKNCRADCLKIGLSYFPPVAQISDANDFDVKLDFCITGENGKWKMENGK